MRAELHAMEMEIRNGVIKKMNTVELESEVIDDNETSINVAVIQESVVFAELGLKFVRVNMYTEEDGATHGPGWYGNLEQLDKLIALLKNARTAILPVDGAKNETEKQRILNC
jgi:hypothetical protein